MRGLISGAFIIVSLIQILYSQKHTCPPPREGNCVVNCANHTITGSPRDYVNCSSHATIDSGHNEDLTVLCNAGHMGCQNLIIECPEYHQGAGHCNVQCTADKGCNGVTIDAGSITAEISCMNGDEVCSDMIITNQNFSQNTVNVSCGTATAHNGPVCTNMFIEIGDGATLNLACFDKGICNNLTITEPDKGSGVITLSIENQGKLINSTIDSIDANSLTLYVNENGLVQNNVFKLDQTALLQITYLNSTLLQNNFMVDLAGNVSITSDHSSIFSQNQLFGNNLKNEVIIRNTLISNSNINCSSVPSFKLFDSVLSGHSEIDVSTGNNLNIINSQITTNSIIRADNRKMTDIRYSIIDNSLLDVSYNGDVNIINTSLSNTQILATNIKNNMMIYIGNDEMVNGSSSVDAKNANNFSLVCSGLHVCSEHFAVYVPPANQSYITCIGYGCKSLDLYTHNNADDIHFITNGCPCNIDIVSACIDSWDIYCDYDAANNSYLTESHLISATKCTGDPKCCANIKDNVHEPYCPWSSNNYYVCKSGDCLVDCSNINNTNNKYGNFSCDTKESIIDASNATSLTVKCFNNTFGCYNLSVLCPPSDDTYCDISCNSENGCNFLNINTQKTGKLTLKCSADKTCSNISINNQDTEINNFVNLSCTNNGCMDINMNNMGITNLSIDCSGNICSGLILNATNARYIDIIGNKMGHISSSFMYFTNAMDVNIVGGILYDNDIDCNNCNQFIFNCTEKSNYCHDIRLSASNSANFKLLCSKSNINESGGCNNITMTVGSSANKAQILCDYYGCSELNIYSIDAAVTDDVIFNSTNCPCNYTNFVSNCIDHFDLYCNGGSTSAIYSNAACLGGSCCGDIVEAFKEPDCSPFNCDKINNKQCNINCKQSQENGINCHNQVIYAKNITGLMVDCTDADCSGLEIDCPYYDKSGKNGNVTSECNINCNNGNCTDIKIKTDGINKLHFSCSGICDHISIDNNYNNNNARNALSINCNDSQCNNITINNGGQSTINITCFGINCIYDTLILTATNAKKININGRIINSILNIKNTKTVNLNVMDMINNEINGNNTENLQIINKNGNVTNNNFNINYAQNVFIENGQIYEGNKIYGDSVKSFTFKCNNKYIKCGSSGNDSFYLNNAGSVNINISDTAGNGFEGDIFAVNSSINVLIGSDIDITDNTLYLNAYNSSYLNINNNGIIGDILINATMSKQVIIINDKNGKLNLTKLMIEKAKTVNILNNGNINKIAINASNSNITIQCRNNSVCDIQPFTANKAKYVGFDINTNNVNVDIDAINADTVNINIGPYAVINDKNNLFIEALNVRLFNITIDGVLSDCNKIKISNVSQYIMNGKGITENCTINGNIIPNVVINGLNLLKSELNVNNATKVFINSATFDSVTINSQYVLNMNILSKQFTNSYINGKYATNISFYCQTKECKIIENTFDVSLIKHLLINISNNDAIFALNKLYANNSDIVEITNIGNFSNNLVFGNNIANSFIFNCLEPTFKVCGYNDLFNLKYAKNVIFNINGNAQNKENINSINITASKSKSVEINIGSKSLSQNIINVNAESANSVSIVTNGTLYDSIIDGKFANHLSIICNTNNVQYGCQNVTIFTSPKVNNLPTSSIECIEYGCQSLYIHTRDSSADFNISSSKCPCSLEGDQGNLCINKWQIYCLNDSSISTFKGMNQCLGGKCCANIDKRLQEESCINGGGSKKKTDWTLIIILICVGVVVIAGIVGIYLWRKRKKGLLLND